MIPSGGTSGKLRFAIHTRETLFESARAFLEFFGQPRGHHALCVLPMHHVSGLMQAIRVALSDGRLTLGNPHDPRIGLPDDFEREGCFLSLVPTQLRRLLDDGAAEWLRGFGTIIIGGAALDTALWQKAFDERLPLVPSYGMTETAAMVCALAKYDFLAGKSGVGEALPHAEISIETDSGAASEKNAGRVRVRAKSLCKGTIPATNIEPGEGLLTNDLGWLDDTGSLHIKGRADRVIICGGEKIDPAEIEEAVLATGLVRDVAVIGIPDEKWGQLAAAFYVSATESKSVEDDLKIRLRDTLSPKHVPKKWFKLENLPRSEAGKLDTMKLQSFGLD
jgi:o-succinylbenzoate---CoA ligase